MSTNNVVKKITFSPRFFVFIVIGISIIGWMLYGVINSISPPRVEWGKLDSSFSVEAVIVRDEQIVTATNYGRLECLTAEGEFVYEGTGVAELYLSNYSKNDIATLNSIQQEIKDYQSNNILKNIINDDLETINENIDALIDEISRLAIEDRNREIPAKGSELKVLMEQRRIYMNEVLPSDANLDKFIQQEIVLQEKILENVVTMHAPRDGVISFFMDEMESYLNYSFLETMTNNEYESMKSLIDESYKSISFGQDSQLNINQAVYRVVNPNLWYVVMKIPRNQSTLVSSQSYMVNFNGYEYGYVNGYVEFLREATRDVIVVMRFTENIGTMATLRTVTCNFGNSEEGYKVPREYVQYVDGIYGITVRKSGRLFVPINIHSQDDTHVIISSIDEENKLKLGLRLVKVK